MRIHGKGKALGLVLFSIAAFLPTEALAHASERGHVLLLPTGYYRLGGALAVAISFLVLALAPVAPFRRLARWRVQLLSRSPGGRLLGSLATFVLLLLLVAAGFAGSRDPLANPLPLAVWTLLWVGLVLACGVLWNLWRWINPWRAPWRLAVWLGWPTSGLMRLPVWVGRWPAVLLLLGFLWFQLVTPAPDDPQRLAIAVSFYFLFAFLGVLVFGWRGWMRQAEFLSCLFARLARLALLEAKKGIFIGLPGHRLTAARPETLSGTILLLALLGGVSFDGLSHTFFWAATLGFNPLEYPGRTALMPYNTAGLIGAVALLAGLYLLSIWAGCLLAGSTAWRIVAGALVWSIVPIALAYHFAHYLPALAVEAQYAFVAISDPFDRGRNLFGTAHLHVHAGITLGSSAARLIWNLQAGAIIGGHVLAVLIAHLAASRIFGSRRRSLIAQIPLALLMVAYTVFGLWLLSTPTVG